MVLGSIPVLSIAFLIIAIGSLLLIGGYYYSKMADYYYKGHEVAPNILKAGGVLVVLGLLLIAYFVYSFG